MSVACSKPRALVGDGESLLREGIGSLLSPAFRTTYALDALGEAFVRGLEQLRPDLVIFLSWPRQSHVFCGIIKKLKSVHANARTIILSEDAEHDVLSDALAAGVDGYLTRDITAETLRHSLQLIMLGERAYSARVVDQLLRGRRNSPLEIKTRTGATLPNRQRDILRDLPQGQSHKPIPPPSPPTDANPKAKR